MLSYIQILKEYSVSWLLERDNPSVRHLPFASSPLRSQRRVKRRRLFAVRLNDLLAAFLS